MKILMATIIESSSINNNPFLVKLPKLLSYILKRTTK